MFKHCKEIRNGISSWHFRISALLSGKAALMNFQAQLHRGKFLGTKGPELTSRNFKSFSSTVDFQLGEFVLLNGILDFAARPSPQTRRVSRKLLPMQRKGAYTSPKIYFRRQSIRITPLNLSPPCIRVCSCIEIIARPY